MVEQNRRGGRMNWYDLILVLLCFLAGWAGYWLARSDEEHEAYYRGYEDGCKITTDIYRVHDRIKKLKEQNE